MTADNKQIIHIDFCRRAGFGMVRRKINKFFFMLLLFWNLKKDDKEKSA